MKVVYFITASMYGRGGHYYSLYETASQVANHESVTVISIGLNRSPVLDGLKCDYIHVDYTGIWSTLKKILKIINCENAHVIHAFDVKSFFYARVISIVSGLPTVLTRCGGENPKRFPYNDELIVYSNENLNYFRNSYNYRKANVSLIPNRASLQMQDYEAIAELKSLLGSNGPIILRVNRIAAPYKKSILQSIRLVNSLGSFNISVQLVVIGFVQDQDVFEELQKFESDRVRFITDSKYTVNASRLIDVADYVVGTGRGFMEASLLGKIMLIPASNTELPVLVSKENVEEVFNYNYSPRYREERTREELFEELLSCFSSDAKQDRYDLTEYAAENFSSSVIYDKHLPIYKRARKARFLILQIMYQALTIVKPRAAIRKFLKIYIFRGRN